MKQNSTFRQEARAALKGKWAMFALITLIYSLICFAYWGIAFVLSYLMEEFQFKIAASFFNVLVTLLFAPLSYGFTVAFLNAFRNKQIPSLLCGYKQPNRGTMIVKWIYTYLWSLLLVIPGIIKLYSYAMTEYILQDNPELYNYKAVEASMAMMRGRKGKLFLLDLSFIGWYILGILSLGIGLLWVLPYHQSARAAFYEDIKSSTDEK